MQTALLSTLPKPDPEELVRPLLSDEALAALRRDADDAGFGLIEFGLRFGRLPARPVFQRVLDQIAEFDTQTVTA